jgi:predicted Fe-Mo cluster-binding NifX family protein
MRIALPLHQGRFSAHFGGAEEFAFYTVDEASRTVRERMHSPPPEHGRGVFPMWLRNQGANVVLAGGMGPRASGILAQHGIEVVVGIQGDDPDAVVQAYLEGSLEASGDVCHEHGYHDCGHDHGDHHGRGHGGCHDD